MKITDATVNEIILALSHYIRTIDGNGNFDKKWIDRVYKLREKLIKMHNAIRRDNVQ